MLQEAWRAEILGKTVLRGGQEVVTHVRDRNLMALVAMLCLQPDLSVPRSRLIEALWPDQEEEVTANRLRVLLHRLRTLVEPLGVERGTVLQSRRHVVALNRAGFSCDATDFLIALDAARRIQVPAERLGLLEHAAQLYTGELLPGFYHNWVIAERAHLATLHFETLRHLTRDAIATCEPERGLSHARQAVLCEPLDEEANFALIQILSLVGQTSEALRQYEQYRSMLNAEIGVSPSDQTKGLVNRLRQQEPLTTAPILAHKMAVNMTTLTPSQYGERKDAPKTQPVNLPPRLTRFFGREAEIDSLRSLLAPSTPTRLVTLLGPGGVGKTRLAIETAQQLLFDYSGRVFYVGLADVVSASQIPDALLHSLHLSPSRGQDTFSQALLALGSEPVLLVLDNLEQLLPDANAWIAHILSEAVSVHCLVTSRRSVGIDGERVYALESLSLPSTNGPEEHLAQYPAVALFVDRARAVRVDFALTQKNAFTVLALCRRLEGMPLALELAAARVRVLSVQEMLEQIGTGLDWLTDVRGGKDTRHRSLRAAIGWSYRLLKPQMARIFCALSVFVSGFTSEAAAAVCDDASSSDILAILETLCCDSLLFVREDAVGKTRFGMLESLRVFGQEQLAAEGVSEAIRGRHLKWFTAVAEAPIPEEITLQRARVEEDGNFRAALEYGMRPDAHPKEQVLAGRLARTLPDHFMTRGNVTEGRTLLECAIALPVEEPLKIAIRSGAARLAIQQGDYAHATSLLSENQAAARAAEDSFALGTCLLYLGMVAFHEGDYAIAGTHLNEALAFLSPSGNRKRIAECLIYIGLRHWYQAEHLSAKQYLEQARAIYQELDSRRGVADCLLKLGNVYRDQGDLAGGEALLDQALAVFQALNHRHAVATTLHDLGLVARFGGNYPLAEARFSQALATFRDIGAQLGAAACLHNLAGMALGNSQWDTGRHLLLEAMEIFSRMGERRAIAETFIGLSVAYEGIGRLEEAAEAASQSITIDCEIENKQGISIGKNRLGSVRLAQGLLDEAQHLFQESLEQNIQIESRPSIMLSLASFATLAHNRKDWARAVRLAATVAVGFQAMGGQRTPYEVQCIDKMLSDSKIALGEAAFEIAWQSGTLLPLADACAEAWAISNGKFPVTPDTLHR